MDDNKVNQLIKSLYGSVGTNKIIWEATTDDNRFIANFKNYSIVVGTEDIPYEGERITRYTLSILNDSGDNIETFAIDYYSKPILGTESAYDLARKIYDFARGKAKGIDDAVDDLLKQIENLY